MFLIYVRDVAKFILSFCIFYTDLILNTILLYAGKNFNKYRKCVKFYLKLLEKWSDVLWLLKFNPNKTKVVYLAKQKHNEIPKLF